jgi:hypothetical protein
VRLRASSQPLLELTPASGDLRSVRGFALGRSRQPRFGTRPPPRPPGRRDARPAARHEGYALLLVLIFTGLGLFLLSGMMDWSSTSTSLVQRNNLYYNTLAVSQGAVDKVVAQMSSDFQSQGQTMTQTAASYYSRLDPRPPSGDWSKYQFSDGSGNLNQTAVQQLTNWAFGPLDTQYSGLYGYAATYKITANVKALNTLFNISSAVKEQIQVASIPIFGFGVFYALDMEICPGSALSLGGRIHGNGNIYLDPSGALTLQSHVTSAQQINLGPSPLDPVSRTFGQVTFQGNRDSGVDSLNLRLGTNNTAAGLRDIVEIPPALEDRNSALGQQRYYNKADLIILISNSTVTATSGSYNGFSTSVSWLQSQNIIATNSLFYDLRENMYMQTTDIDIHRLGERYSNLTSALGRAATTIYIADLRTQYGWTEPAIRLLNGKTLPPYGLTIATPDPLYIEGDYNVPDPARGTTNTTGTLPASVVADAITVLSGNWNDSRAWWPLAWRNASSTTVNAAMLAGIVPSNRWYYSGGVENFIRLLESWSGQTLTFNGSVVVLFASQIATASWGAGSGIYDTPTRKFSFDPNFLNASRLPPATPNVRTVIRSQWSAIQGS